MRWLLLLGSLLAGCVGDSRQEIVVLAAASLTDAAEALAHDFEIAHADYRILLSTGPTSMLARQIEHGVPADIFLSANLAWLEHLDRQGRVAVATVLPMGTALVVAGRPSGLSPQSLAELGSAARIAVADPTHVPAGMYARAGLTCAGMWRTLQHQLVPTMDVRAALVSMTSGAADVAIVYASDVLLSSDAHILFSWPAACAPGIRYGAALLSRASNEDAAREFLSFVADTARHALWRRFGFAPRRADPGDSWRFDDSLAP